LTLKQLGYHQKPVVILNTAAYYAPLLEMLQRATDQHFMKPHNLEYFYLAATPEEALEYLASYQPGPFEPKWFAPKPAQARQGEVPGTE
jgi:predicted Rossmann-fold nucleotide-binding protein